MRDRSRAGIAFTEVLIEFVKFSITLCLACTQRHISSNANPTHLFQDLSNLISQRQLNLEGN